MGCFLAREESPVHKNKNVPLLGRPNPTEFYDIWHTRKSHGDNQACLTFVNRFRQYAVLTLLKLIRHFS